MIPGPGLVEQCFCHKMFFAALQTCPAYAQQLLLLLLLSPVAACPQLMLKTSSAASSCRPSHLELGQKELTGFCRERLAAYQTPKRWRFVQQLPRNAMGKLNKKEMIKELLASTQPAGAAGAAA